MASNQLPTSIRTRLKNKLDSIFGRVLRGFACPLTWQEREILARCNLSDEDDQHIQALRGTGTLNMEHQAPVYLSLASGENILLRLHISDSEAPARNFEGVSRIVSYGQHPFPRRRIAARLGDDVARGFFDWLEQAVVLSREIDNSLAAFEDIMRMTKTAGHLRRMVPELYRLLPALNQTSLSRTSAVPYEWSSYPRQNVELLTHTIAKCLLLEDDGDAKWGKATWSLQESRTWPVMGMPI